MKGIFRSIIMKKSEPMTDMERVEKAKKLVEGLPYVVLPTHGVEKKGLKKSGKRVAE